MTTPAYTITAESITVILKGKTHTTQRGTPNYLPLREAILTDDWEKVNSHLTVASSVEKWAKGKFKYENDKLSYDGEYLPDELSDRITALASEGKSPMSIMRFWEKLQKNPSYRSVKQLWGFLNHKNIPLTEDGCFLAYKGVKMDYTDAHSGTFVNKPGATHKMPRNRISDDPNVPCHEGFHVGSLNYARSFSHRTMVCKVDPENVVCVPKDSSQGKMRVCEYEVLGNYGSELPSTSIDTRKDELPEPTPVKARGKAAKERKGTKERKPAKGWTKFHNMDMADLMGQGIMELRQYAGKGLLILGASKIPGGKTALVARILEVRREQ